MPPPGFAGPERLDLGDVLYAPNAFVDARGCVLMLAWLQELRGDASSGFDYAGCLSLPRVLTLQGGSQSLYRAQPLWSAGRALPWAVTSAASFLLCNPWMKVYRAAGCHILLCAKPWENIYPRGLQVFPRP